MAARRICRADAQASAPSRVKRPRDTEAEIGAMIVGGEPEADSRAEAHWIADPGTAANDTVVAIALRCPGRAVVGCPFVVGVQTILDPLPDVALHIVEAELVGGKRTNRSGSLAVPLAAAAVAIGIIFPKLVAPGIDRCCSGASRILPFGFGEQ